MVQDALDPQRSVAARHGCTFTVPVKAESLNRSGRQTHWGQRARRSKKHRLAVAWSVLGIERPTLPCVVTLTRIAPSNGLDGDNLAGSLKAVRDGVAEWLGVDDRDPGVEWRYSQARGQAGHYAVHVEAAPK